MKENLRSRPRTNTHGRQDRQTDRQTGYIDTDGKRDKDRKNMGMPRKGNNRFLWRLFKDTFIIFTFERLSLTRTKAFWQGVSAYGLSVL